MRKVLKERVRAGVFCVSISVAACSEQVTEQHETRHSAPPAGHVRVTEASPMHWKVAALDAGENVVSEGTLHDYERVFARLDGKCRHDRSTIADVAQVAVKGLHEKGKSMSRLQFLQSLDASIPDEMQNADCKELAAVLWTLLETQ